MDMADHIFQPTMGGRCAKAGCARTREAHPATVAVNPFEPPCSVDHKTLRTRQFPTPGGVEWARCPGCGVQLEAPAAARA